MWHINQVEHAIFRKNND